mgnify:CR=1 FL=1
MAICSAVTAAGRPFIIQLRRNITHVLNTCARQRLNFISLFSSQWVAEIKKDHPLTPAAPTHCNIEKPLWNEKPKLIVYNGCKTIGIGVC